MPVLNIRWKLSFSLALAAFVTIIAIVGWANFREGIALKDKFNAFGVDVDSQDINNALTNWTSAPLAVAITVSMDSFDPTKSNNVLGFHIDSTPINNLPSTELVDITVPSVPVRFVSTSSTLNFAANVSMATQSQTLFLDGDVNSYPFDSYTADYELHAYSSPSNISLGDPLPITAYVFGTVQGFTINTVFQGNRDDGSGVVLSFTVRRSAVSKLFAVIVFLVMWCLSGGIFVAAMSVWFRERKVEPPVIAISTALLFALPNVRNSQPGIPPVAGTTSDMTGFFWNILLVAISAFSLLINWIIKTRREPPKKVDPAPMQASSAIDLERGRPENMAFNSHEKRL